MACAAVLAAVPGAALGADNARGTLLLISNATASSPTGVSLVDLATGAMRTILHGKDIWGQTAAWSPDGRWIALARGTRVELLRADGGDAHDLPALRTGSTTTSTSSPSFSWSPSSRALVTTEAAGHRLVIRGIDGGARVIARAGPGTVFLDVSWSPNGRWIAYERDVLSGGANGGGCCSASLRLMHPDGTGDRTISALRDSAHDAASPAQWTPGSDRFAFATEGRDPRDPTLGLVATVSGTVTSVREVYATPLGWSHAGRGLAVLQAPPSDAGPNTLALVAASGRSHVLSTILPPIWAGSWSPDGGLLAVSGANVAYANGDEKIGDVDLELVDPVDGTVRVLARLPRGTEVDELAWRP
jgi:dipeptidyl aminopeptidase/acylaminoacyl peptidase